MTRDEEIRTLAKQLIVHTGCGAEDAYKVARRAIEDLDTYRQRDQDERANQLLKPLEERKDDIREKQEHARRRLHDYDKAPGTEHVPEPPRAVYGSNCKTHISRMVDCPDCTPEPDAPCPDCLCVICECGPSQ